MVVKTLLSFVPGFVWNLLEAMMMNIVAPVFMPVRLGGDSCEPAPAGAGSPERLSELQGSARDDSVCSPRLGAALRRRFGFRGCADAANARCVTLTRTRQD